MAVQKVSTGYKPRILQLQLHKELKRFNVIVCHRRFGKTHLAVNEILDRAFRCTQKNPQFAYLAPTYGQAKRIVWDIIKEYVKDIPGVETNEADLRIDISRPGQKDRIRIMLLGAENPGSLKGIYLDGVVLDEFAEMNPQVWSESIRPALSDRLGWAIFIGTPKGMNHFHDMRQFALADMAEKGTQSQWFTALYKASQTGIIPIGELEAARAVMDESEYMQEYECSFAAALVGAYYGKEMEKAEAEGRVTDVAYDPALPVYTFWDLGIDDTTVIWFAQKLGNRQIRWIDYHEESGQGLPHYAKILQQKGYVYAEHILPHDGAARELGTGKSRQETLKSLVGSTRVTVQKRHDISDGINASRLILAKSWFDRAKCERGINALKNYQRVWDAKNKIFQQRPKHDWASHGADAFRTGALGIDENGPTEEQKRRYPRESIRDYDVV